MWCLVVFHDAEFTTAWLCKVCAPFSVAERVNPLAAFPFSPADFYPHFYSRFLPPFLLPIFPPIFTPIFTPDFAGDFYPRFSLAIFRGCFSPSIFYRQIQDRFSPLFFLCKISTCFIWAGWSPTRPSTNLQKTTRSPILQKVPCCEPKSPLPKNHPRPPPSLIPKSLYPLKGI